MLLITQFVIKLSALLLGLSDIGGTFLKTTIQREQQGLENICQLEFIKVSKNLAKEDPPAASKKKKVNLC